MKYKTFPIYLLTSLIYLLLPIILWANSEETDPHRPIRYEYSYRDREHSFNETATQVGTLFGLNWIGYYLVQAESIHEHGSFKAYRKHFGSIVFDKDQPVWNLMIHPFVGSQLFLYFRANGYSRSSSFLLTFLQSALFEFFIEIYTEPASIPDLYQTPVYGTTLGVLFEISSLYLLNSGSGVLKFFGHLLNPSTLFGFYEGKIQIQPQIKSKDEASISLTITF